ncbi:MAG: hypothetical protein LBE62_12235 [Azonexus sp.]|jgi:hypothetical protein|nr:hypothetical protein [Azonexus sp.]
MAEKIEIIDTLTGYGPSTIELGSHYTKYSHFEFKNKGNFHHVMVAGQAQIKLNSVLHIENTKFLFAESMDVFSKKKTRMLMAFISGQGEAYKIDIFGDGYEDILRGTKAVITKSKLLYFGLFASTIITIPLGIIMPPALIASIGSIWFGVKTFKATKDTQQLLDIYKNTMRELPNAKAL